ncbi:Pycsar system effector family protein [Streptomyces sp. NPDC088360]|uniref:Pycsar system effector family protein n=1 Tax=Streptomyces sp. NPDC088360 TaxID=3154515 RepID=UPI00344E7139
MSEARDEAQVATHDVLVGEKLRSRGAEMFVEVQRADGKAAALCAVAGGLLTVAGAALSVMAQGPRPPTAILVCSCLLFGSALVAALLAIRPVLPEDRSLTGLEGICAGSTAAELVAAFQAMNRPDHMHVEAERLTVLTALACRKFQALKMSADLNVAGILVAGIGLLITYITS